MEEVVGSIPTRSTKFLATSAVPSSKASPPKGPIIGCATRFLPSDFLGDFPIQQSRWRQANALLGLLAVSLVIVHAVNRTLGLGQ